MRLKQAFTQQDLDNSPETTKRRIFQLLFATLDCLPTPLLLAVEDIHWADDRSLELLLRLARSVPSRQIVLLMTLCPDEPSPALRAFWPRSSVSGSAARSPCLVSARQRRSA